MAEGESLLAERADGVLTLTLNRPDSLNAIDIPLWERLLAAAHAAANDAAVRAVVLRGAGRAFSSGGDLRPDPTTASLGFDERVARLRRLSGVVLILDRMPKPVVAALRGAVAGAAISLALACDFRIASESARFAPGFAKAGFSGDYGISHLLPRLVGAAKAREILMLGEPIEAEEALRLGMVNRVVPDDALDVEVAALAARLAAGPTAAYGYMRANLAAAEDGGLVAAIELEAENMIRCRSTVDHEEAVRAFQEKRPPVFKGC